MTHKMHIAGGSKAFVQAQIDKADRKGVKARLIWHKKCFYTADVSDRQYRKLFM